MRLFQDQRRRKRLSVRMQPSIALQCFEGQPPKHGDNDMDDFRGNDRKIDDRHLTVRRRVAADEIV
jgi:hypothetical protein